MDTREKEIDGTNEFIEVDKVFHNNMASIFQGTNVDEVIDTKFAQIKTHVENPALPKNGFSIGRINNIDIDFLKLKLTRGSSYIETPGWMSMKKTIINPINNDEEFFKYAIIAAIHQEEIGTNHQRISKLRPYVDQYNWQGIEFPTSIKDITKFERNNPDIAVNVFFATGKSFNILRRSAFNERENQTNLLLLTDDKKSHYVAIKNLSRLLKSEISKNHGKMSFCLNCLQGFQTIESRDKHYAYCKDNEAVKITMPSENEKWLYYQDGQQQFKVPFVIYADFESLLIPMKENARDTKTKTLNKHVPCGWCTYSTFAYGEVPDPLKVYRGEDCVQKFVDHLENEVKRLYCTYHQQNVLPLTEILKKEHDSATSCHICMKSFYNDGYSRKVRDHCHYTGLYRGAAHAICNRRYNIPSHVPVIFHNLSGYDAHLFIRELGEKYDTQDISYIAENTEKYISFNVKIKVPIAGMEHGDGETYKKIEIRFIDSCRFMASSLEKLVNNLDDEQCKNLRWYFNEDDIFKLMRKKGVYPYAYMNSWQQFEETELPPLEAFYSKLDMNGINDEEYEHVQKVWNAITLNGPETIMGDYHDVYLVTDVVLLTDIFQNFRSTSHANYKLDPAHFYSAPGLAWKAALKYTEIKLELLTDPDML
ncbi:uncharacterized protein LOC130642280 [Hydractinia symbiolongicarpus]|uniref:uncharacterized protein LOC130642280 n=1 Tax=Hydractinia symbiolongicarpus TaxID=13093 RepID=UPI0025508FB9|nr:uncharacterized protein LOC130642280 [Hydractinia symbiolongicarpus]